MNIGIIGGSGLYKLSDGPAAGESLSVDTPYGAAHIYREKQGEHTALFIARHGEGHVHLPSEVNYRANIFALKKLGATAVISVSAVGSMKKEIAPGEFVLPDQYIDVTRQRPGTFFGRGIVAHVHFADPCCATLRETLAAVMRDSKVKAHVKGTYVCVEGPQFSTRSESNWFRSWNLPTGAVSVIGMTAMPEARLAREAGLCYQTVAMATDYDCWNESAEEVTLEAIMRVLAQNVSTSRKVLSNLLSKPFPACRSHCAELMKNAVVTPKEMWPPTRREEMEILLR